MLGRGELTDKAWRLIEPLLPENGKRGGRWQDHRKVVNGILWKLYVPALLGATCPLATAPGRPATIGSSAGGATEPGTGCSPTRRPSRTP